MNHSQDYHGEGTGQRTPPLELEEAERWAVHAQSPAKTGARPCPEAFEGPAFTVETRSVNGMHQVVGISPTSPEGDRPGPPQTPDETVCVVLRSVARAVLDLAGYETGSALTDVVMTREGPRIRAFRPIQEEGALGTPGA